MPDGFHLSDPAMVGKSGYARREGDPYFTRDLRVVPVVLGVLRAEGHEMPLELHEPACGKGHLSEQLKAYGHRVFSTDITDHGYAGLDRLVDARQLTAIEGQGVFTNLPFEKNLIMEILEHLLMLARRQGAMVAVLVRHAFDAAASTRRRKLFQDPNCLGRIVLSNRVIFEPVLPGGMRSTPRHDYVVYVWDYSRTVTRPGQSFFPTEIPFPRLGREAISVCQGDIFDGEIVGLSKIQGYRKSKLPAAERAAFERLLSGAPVMWSRGEVAFTDTGDKLPKPLLELLLGGTSGLGHLRPLHDALPGFAGSQTWKWSPAPARVCKNSWEPAISSGAVRECIQSYLSDRKKSES